MWRALLAVDGRKVHQGQSYEGVIAAKHPLPQRNRPSVLTSRASIVPQARIDEGKVAHRRGDALVPLTQARDLELQRAFEQRAGGRVPSRVQVGDREVIDVGRGLDMARSVRALCNTECAFKD